MTSFFFCQAVILFCPNETDRSATYNLTDLINTSWIKSETILEDVITKTTKDYIQWKTSSVTAQARSEPVGQAGRFSSLIDYINTWLDPLLGLQKRLHWEGTNRLGQFQSRLGSGFQRAPMPVPQLLNGTTTQSSGWFGRLTAPPTLGASPPPVVVKSTTAAPSATSTANNKPAVVY